MSYQIQKYKVSLVKEGKFPSYSLTNEKDVKHFSESYLQNKGLEEVLVIALDTTNKMIGVRSFEGTTNHSFVYPAEIFRFLLLSGASAFILVHNHPGETKAASSQDWELTRKLQRIGKDMSIPLVDHLIIAGQTTIALRNDARWEEV